jgi:hypothetical protein
MNKDKLKEIIEGLLDVRKTYDLSFTDDSLIDVAIRIYNTGSIDTSKKENIKEMKKEAQEPATESQKWKLNKLGIPIPKDLTKEEAFSLIQEKIGKTNK